MNYELAKKLKDVSFVFSDYALHGYNDDGEIIEYDTCCDRWFNGPLVVKAPTLSELVEACGIDEFANLSRIKTGGDRFWQADACRNGEQIEITIGKTPEEAVANLWLALNKKES